MRRRYELEGSVHNGTLRMVGIGFIPRVSPASGTLAELSEYVQTPSYGPPGIGEIDKLYVLVGNKLLDAIMHKKLRQPKDETPGIFSPERAAVDSYTRLMREWRAFAEDAKKGGWPLSDYDTSFWKDRVQGAMAQLKRYGVAGDTPKLAPLKIAPPQTPQRQFELLVSPPELEKTPFLKSTSKAESIQTWKDIGKGIEALLKYLGGAQKHSEGTAIKIAQARAHGKV